MSTEAILDNPTSTPPALLALDESRVIRLTVGKTQISYEFNPIGEKEWRRCMEAAVTKVEQTGDERIRSNDEAPALAELFTRCVREIMGYKGTDAMTLPQIVARVPFRHRVAVAQVLRAVSVSSATDEATLSDYSEVKLDCPWTADEAGQMQMFTGLVHRFKQPSLDQYRKWRLGTARNLTSGDADNGVTVYPSRLAVALGLYDEMIAEVDGYSFNRAPLVDVEDIKVAMDGMHKARAVMELFDRNEEDILVGSPVTEPTPDADTDAE
jgi:hypothetical protein